ncbi:MAG: hypothetical protein LBL66_08825 [Clostridiales bacterium]|jgi:hypothetical protein|nr:hypothetical protein [Clostridiales bacterium]
MKKGFFKIAYAIVSAAVLAAFCASCAAPDAFNGKGSAEIILEFTEAYEGLSVQCPNGRVTGYGASYKIALKTRAAADVIITCEDYETVTLAFTTADLKTGAVTKSGIDLLKKKVSLILNIAGNATYDDVANLDFEISDGDNAITGKTIDKKAVTLELAKNLKTPLADDFEITVSGTGFYTNKIKIKAPFVNYRAEYRVPALKIGAGVSALTIDNDLPVNAYYTVQAFPYGYVADSGAISDSKAVLLKDNYDYILSGNTDKQIYIKGGRGGLQSERYLTVKASEFSVARGSGGEQTKKPLEIRFVDDADGSAVNANALPLYNTFALYDPIGTKLTTENGGISYNYKANGYELNDYGDGDEFTVIDAGRETKKTGITYYKHKITPSEALSGRIEIRLGKRDDNLPDKVCIRIADKDGAPFGYGGGANKIALKYDAYNYNAFPAFTDKEIPDEAPQLSASVQSGAVEIDFAAFISDAAFAHLGLIKAITDYNEYATDLSQYATDVSGSVTFYTVEWRDLLYYGENGLTITLLKKYSLKIAFKKTDNTFDTTFNFQNAARDGNYYTFQVFDGQPVNMDSQPFADKQYKPLPQFVFIKDFFCKTDGETYQYEVTVYRQKTVAVVFSGTPGFESMLCWVTNADGFKFTGVQYDFLNVPYKITVSEDMAIFNFEGWAQIKYDGGYALTDFESVFAAENPMISVALRHSRW